MKNFPVLIVCLLISIAMPGCALIEGAFKAGIFFALLIVLIIGLIIWLTRFMAILILRISDRYPQKSND